MIDYKGTQIHTDQDYFGDWHATTENYDAENEGQGWFSTHPMGTGKTEQDAIKDLILQLKEQE
jgi:hypothetical protein